MRSVRLFAAMRRAIWRRSLSPPRSAWRRAEDAKTLYDQCFTRTYDAAHLAAHPGQRVAAMSVQFQQFEDDLLASVIYTLRYGTKFGFSGACYVKVEGGFLCDACVNDSCESRGEKFKILWSGGDTVRLVNDSTGMLAENAQGGRDYLAAGGEHGEFVLRRAGARRIAAGRPAARDGDHRRKLQGERPPRARRPAAAAGAEPRPLQLHRQARQGGGGAARVRDAARAGARHQGPRARPSRPLPGGLRSAGDGGRAATCTSPRRPRMRAKIILGICRSVGAKTATKGKSMISEEIGLNEHLAENGIQPIETDLGEYIIQLRGEVPSHIIAPAVHVNQDQVEADFRRVHTHLPPDRDLSEPTEPARGSARHPARPLPRRRRRHHRREFPGRRDGLVDHRHQRGQRRPHADPAAHPHRHRLDREDRADADGRLDDPAAAGALGHRAGHVGLHDLLDRAAPAGAIPTGRPNITSSSSTTAAPRCSAPSTRRCCAASAAAPA